MHTNNKEGRKIAMRQINEVYPKQPSPCHCMNLRRASRAITQFYDAAMADIGLTIAQLALLRHLELLAPVTISELAKRMRIDRTTLNRNMKPLAEAGLIIISPGRDSRTRQVELTAAGNAAVIQGWQRWQEAQVSVEGYLGKETMTTLTQLLSKIEALVP
ncbi:MAG TPA: MarR family winged helix-turn-helix transcriptional regulator [Patescibacteria group bacterium]|nr:MarR family winged helix-turn-helix transcriptional regulator [Patescibacteria group bacterium]